MNDTDTDSEIRQLIKKMKIEFIDEISYIWDETEEIIAVLEKALQPKCIKVGKCFEEKPCGYLQKYLRDEEE